MVVTSDYHSTRANQTETSVLVLCLERLMLTPLLQVTKHERLTLLNIVYKDISLQLITIPVLGLVLFVETTVVVKEVDGPSGLTNSRFTIEPDIVVLQITFQRLNHLLVPLSLDDVLGTFKLRHMTKRNLSRRLQLIQTLLHKHGISGSTLLLALSFHILVQGLCTKLKRAFNTGVLLHTIGGCSVVDAYGVPVRVLTHLLHGSDALARLRQIHKELYMHSSLLAFLQLAYRVNSVGTCVDGLQPVLEHEIGILLNRIVEGANVAHEVRGLSGHLTNKCGTEFKTN